MNTMSNNTEKSPKPNFVGSPKMDCQSSVKTKDSVKVQKLAKSEDLSL